MHAVRCDIFDKLAKVHVMLPSRGERDPTRRGNPNNTRPHPYTALRTSRPPKLTLALADEWDKYQ